MRTKGNTAKQQTTSQYEAVRDRRGTPGLTYHEEVELVPTGLGSTQRGRVWGPGGDLRVDARELVDGRGDAEAGDVRLQQALVQWVRRDGRLLPLPSPSDAGAVAGVPGRGVHPQHVVVRVLERHPAREGQPRSVETGEARRQLLRSRSS
jgi:hypothetical protein